MIRNIIFDWSGTLADDLPAVWKATNLAFARVGLPEMSLDRFRAEFCLPFSAFYDRHAPGIPLRRLEGWYHKEFKRVQDSVCALPHAREFLEFCLARKIRAFLLSSVHGEHFAVQARLTGFGRYLEKAYVAVRDKRKKIHDILVENRLKAGETLFVGDMQHDIETARLGGIHSCAVLTGYNTLSQLREAEPDLIVEHLGELRARLEGGSLDGAGAAAPRMPLATVGALIFNDAGQVLMIRTHKWSNLWGIPGGKIKWGESSVAALRREIKEETNLAVSDVEFVLVQDCIRSKEFYREAHFVLLNYTCRRAGRCQVKLNEEAREFRWVPPRRALQMPVNGPTRKLLRAVIEGAEAQRLKKGIRKHVENQHR